MLRADDLTVVHHDDSVSHFTDVRYTLGGRGLRVVLATGEEIFFPRHEVLTTEARTAARIDRSGAYLYAVACDQVPGRRPDALTVVPILPMRWSCSASEPSSSI
jgi:hypothetical protein